MKSDPRLTVELHQVNNDDDLDDENPSENTLSFTQLVNGAVANNLAGILNSLLITVVGYRHSSTTQLFKGLPDKIGRSKDLAYIISKIGRTVCGAADFAPLPVFSNGAHQYDMRPIVEHRVRVIKLIVEILNSNRNPYLKLALLQLIRNSGDYKVSQMFLYTRHNCTLIYDVQPSDITFDDLVKDTNLLDLLRNDSYMSGVLSKFKVVGPEIEKQYPDAYKAAIVAINKILGADSVSEVLVPYQHFLETLIEYVNKGGANKTFERIFNLDCGCEHRPRQSRDLVIGEIIYQLYKLESK